jgi:hypothetical protein
VFPYICWYGDCTFDTCGNHTIEAHPITSHASTLPPSPRAIIASAITQQSQQHHAIVPMCVPRKSSFSSETHQVKPPAIHRYRGTTTTAERRESGSVLHVFAFRRYTSILYPIVSATIITPSLAGRKASNLIDLALHAVMRKTRRVSVSRHVIRTASTYIATTRPSHPCLLVSL